MKDYLIATSSTADLPRTWLDEHRIPFISYSYTVNGESREDDCREESRAAVYKGMRAGDDLKTSMINEYVYYDFFKSLMETCRMEKLNDMEKKDYEKSVLEYEDVQDAIAYARKTALEEGKTEGEAKGEANATRTIAAKMLASGMDAATISSLTGLTEEEIQKLQH